MNTLPEGCGGSNELVSLTGNLTKAFWKEQPDLDAAGTWRAHTTNNDNNPIAENPSFHPPDSSLYQ